MEILRIIFLPIACGAAIFFIVIAWLQYKEIKSDIGKHKKFIEEKKKSWNKFVDELIKLHEGTNMEQYVLDHFVKFKEENYEKKQ